MTVSLISVIYLRTGSFEKKYFSSTLDSKISFRNCGLQSTLSVLKKLKLLKS